MHKKKPKKSSGKKHGSAHASKKELRLHYFKELGSISEDKEALIKLIKRFFSDAFQIKQQFSYEELQSLIARKKLDQDLRSSMTRFIELLIEIEYSPNKKNQPYAKIEELFRKIIFSVTMSDEKENQLIPVHLKNLKKIVTKSVSPLQKLFAHFFPTKQHKDGLNKFKELEKKCNAYLNQNEIGKARRIYKLMIRRYDSFDINIKNRLYSRLTKVHARLRASIPHEAHLRQAISNFPSNIPPSRKQHYKETYLKILDYNNLPDARKRLYYSKIHAIREMLR